MESVVPADTQPEPEDSEGELDDMDSQEKLNSPALERDTPAKPLKDQVSDDGIENDDTSENSDDNETSMEAEDDDVMSLPKSEIQHGEKAHKLLMLSVTIGFIQVIGETVKQLAINTYMVGELIFPPSLGAQWFEKSKECSVGKATSRDPWFEV